MAEGSDLLSPLRLNICQYFRGTCLFLEYKIIERHTSNLKSTGDLSYVVNKKIWKGYTPVEHNGSLGLDAVHFDQKFIEDFLRRSQSWSLRIANCKLEDDKLLMYLDRPHAFKNVLHLILSHRKAYGKSLPNSQDFHVTTDCLAYDTHKMDLSQFRVHLMSQVVRRLLQIVICPGLSSKGKEPVLFHVTNRQICELQRGCVKIFCGVVLNRKKKNREKHMLVGDYIRMKSEDMHSSSDARNQKTEKAKLIEAGLILDLLSSKTFRSVSVDMEPNKATDTNTAGINRAIPVLYTCARIATLLKHFENLVKEGACPELIPFDEVDFSLLVKDEEWELLFGWLLPYPSILQDCVQHIITGQPSPNVLCNFVVSFCKVYSLYYHFVRVLVVSGKHLMGTVFARIYLLQGIEQILHNALAILGIEPVSAM